ncbi:MAG: acyl carrier protein [Sandaracinaceae bacterium]|nr:acyl carrier protein [Sandaracinaceae bacterium]
MDEELTQHCAEREAILARLRTMLVDDLRVRVEPEQIDLDAPLFGTGLGLDSIDAVELVVAIESAFGLRFPEEQTGPWRFRTVHSLLELVLDPPEGSRP